MINFKLNLEKRDKDLIMQISFIIAFCLLVFAVVELGKYISGYDVVLDNKGLGIDGSCKLNVFYYYDYYGGLVVARDTKDGIVWCENVKLSYSDYKKIEFR